MATKKKEELHMMPKEVKDWIDRAGSIMTSQKSKIEDLQAQIKDLKAYKKWAEKRLTQADVDD
jgi:uncharacterized coiled-coil DUF342 family protein